MKTGKQPNDLLKTKIVCPLLKKPSKIWRFFIDAKNPREILGFFIDFTLFFLKKEGHRVRLH